MLPINEVFETIQGEASYTGTPSIFIRLQGCPVGCAWCDTKHTWHVKPENKKDYKTILLKQSDNEDYTEQNEQSIVDQFKNAYRARHVVITGGEPCLYDLTLFTTLLIENGFSVQIETSGTHEILCHKNTFVTVSPKINMPGGYKVRTDALARANEIKHPVGKPADIDNLRLEVLPHINTNLIWLQPLSQSKKATDLCVDMATANHWKISIQTHKFIGVR